MHLLVTEQLHYLPLLVKLLLPIPLITHDFNLELLTQHLQPPILEPLRIHSCTIHICFQPQVVTSTYFRGVEVPHTATIGLAGVDISLSNLTANLTIDLTLIGGNTIGSLSPINQGEWIYSNADALYKITEYGKTATLLIDWSGEGLSINTVVAMYDPSLNSSNLILW